MLRKALLSAAIAATLPLLAVFPAAAANTIVTQPEALEWGPAAGLPEGAQIAVLYGDPASTGPFAIRLKFPAGYQIPLHSHPTDELITLVSGEARMAFGESADIAYAEPMVPGTFIALPGGKFHRLWIDKDTIVELHSTGPFATHLH